MRNRRAFTLIEVMVALAMLAGSMVLLLVIRNRQLDRLQRALDRSEASELALEEVAKAVCDPRQAASEGLHAAELGRRFLVRRSRNRVWLGRTPVNVVAVTVHAADRTFGRPLVEYSLCLSDSSEDGR